MLTANPDFTKPERTAPFLTSLAPPPYQIQTIPRLQNSYQTTTISFEVISEDLQSVELDAMLLRDFRGFGLSEDLIIIRPIFGIPVGHLNSEPRHQSIEFLISPTPIEPGCHSVTLIITHQLVQNMQNGKIEPKDPDDISTVTWWYAVGLDPSNPTLDIRTCITSTPDAGADAGSEAGGP